ncbi:dethiobiotin synthase [Myroides sp. LJL119]
MHQYFITGIGTEIGKTLTSAILVQYFKASYFKPIQSGDLNKSDTMRIKELCEDLKHAYLETYALKLASSPHKSAALENITIDLDTICIPKTSHNLIIEGAGGLFVPCNQQHFIIDLIQNLKLPVILVVKDYLGCINHTILSVSALQSRGINLKYVVFNGDFDVSTKQIIIKHLPKGTSIIEIPFLNQIDRKTILETANNLKIYNL